MYKNQLQELAQRSCFNLPSYTSTREGPDHAPRFKSSVNFNGETFITPLYYTTLRQSEHAAAEIALNSLSSKCPSKSLSSILLDESGIYKNLLQETSHRAGLNLPVYTTVRSGPGHAPVFTCNVEIAGLSFDGEPAKTKKQAEKNAAIAAWSGLKKRQNLDSLTKRETTEDDDDDKAIVTRVLSNLKPKEDTKQIKRSECTLNQARRPRMVVKSYRDNTINSLIHQKLKLMDLVIDSTPNSFRHKQTSFVSPPTSKILPPSIQFKGQSCLEEQWLKSKCLGSQNQVKTTTLRTQVYYNERMIAPTVQIRSVIPVFAAPPPPPPPPPRPPICE